MEKLWTASEVAQCLGITEPEVEALVRHGTLTGYKLGGEFLRFRPAQVEALKGAVTPGRAAGRSPSRRGKGWVDQFRDFLYFYDFYLVSAGLLAVLTVYLIVSG